MAGAWPEGGALLATPSRRAVEAAVSVRGPFLRFLTGLALACAAVVAVVGGIALRGPGVVAVCVSGALAGCVAAGVASESDGSGRRSAVEAAVQAAAVTIGGLLIVSGTAVIAGGGTALLLVLVAGSSWAALRWLRGRRETAMPAGSDLRATSSAWVPGAPVAGLPTAALGEEWLRTSDALRGPLVATARQRLVTRRSQVLDELERRDPAGFARWLAADPLHAGDPAGFVRGEPPHADPSTETEAA